MLEGTISSRPNATFRQDTGSGQGIPVHRAIFRETNWHFCSAWPIPHRCAQSQILLLSRAGVGNQSYAIGSILSYHDQSR
jgi:hypothetical protein